MDLMHFIYNKRQLYRPHTHTLSLSLSLSVCLSLSLSVSVSVSLSFSLSLSKMAKHAWDGYTQFAWGENELKPLSKTGHSAVVFGKTHLGATIVDSLDTLYLMGLQDRFEQGKEWVRLSLNIDQVGVVSCGCGLIEATPPSLCCVGQVGHIGV